MKIAIVLVLITAAGIAVAACRRREASADAHSLAPVPASRYKPGQVWSFRAPSDQTGAVLTILRVEANPKLGTIVHIALSGSTLPNGGTNVQHMPFSEQAIDKSVLTLVRENQPLPDFRDGYAEWRQAFDAGRGGIFTVSVGEGFEAIRTAITKQAN
jgi:hypothetical protein